MVNASNPGVRGYTDALTQQVEADFPGWRVWRSRDRRGQPASWWASRRGTAEPRTAAGDTEAELRASLAGALSAEGTAQ